MTLSTKTPLSWLLRDGEFSRRPQEVTQQWAVWVPKTKSFRELGIDVDEPSPGTRASEIGQVAVDGGDFLQFLIRFRRIVEGDAARTHVLQSLRSLEREYPQIAKCLGGDLGQMYVCRELQSIKGCGAATAKKLYAAGYLSREDVLTASPEALSENAGIGKSTAKSLIGPKT